MAAAPADEPLVVVEKTAWRLLERVEDADLLLADLRELPVGRMVPGPKGAIGEARLLADVARGARTPGRRSRDDVLDRVDHPRDAARVDCEPRRAVRDFAAIAERTFGERRVRNERELCPAARFADVELWEGLPQPPLDMRKSLAAFDRQGWPEVDRLCCSQSLPPSLAFACRSAPFPRADGGLGRAKIAAVGGVFQFGG